MASYDFGFREVIPDQTLPEKWKEVTINTGGTQSTLQDIKVPERAGGFTYKDTTLPYTRNRFIYWRISHDVLELVEQSLDINLVHNHVRFRFQDSPILEGVSIQETANSVQVLVPTVSSVHRLVFPHPDAITSRSLQAFNLRQPQDSVFVEAGINCVQQQYIIHHSAPNSTLPHLAASYLAVNDEAIFALQYNSGSTLVVRMDYISGLVSATELKETTLVSRLLGIVPGPLLRTKTSDDDFVTSLVLHTLGLATYLFTLSQDCKLKMWSVDRQECIMAANLLDFLHVPRPQQGIPEPGRQNHMLRKAVGRDENDLHIGIFLSFARKSAFLIMKPVSEQGYYDLKSLIAVNDNQVGAENDLVDFWISCYSIWAMWANPVGETIVRHRRFRDEASHSHGTNWTQVVPENALDRNFDPSAHPNLEAKQAYLSYIFHPGKLPLSVINRALTIFRRPTGGAMPTQYPEVSASVLKERVAVVVENEIKNEISDLEITDEEYIEISWRAWAKFYSCCVQYYWAGTRPVAFLAAPANDMIPGPLSNNPIGIVCKAQFSLFRPIDELEHLWSIGSGSSGSSDISTFNPVTRPNNVCTADMVTFFQALYRMEKHLPDEIKENFLKALFYQQDPKDFATNLVEEYDSEYFSRRSANKLLSGIMPDMIDEVVHLLTFYSLDHNAATEMDIEGEDLPRKELDNISFLFSSQLGSNVVAEALHQSSQGRFQVLRNLLFLLLCLKKHLTTIFPKVDVNSTTAERLRVRLIPHTAQLIRCYYIINWVATSSCGLAVPTMLDASIQQLNILSMRDKVEGADAVHLALRGNKAHTLLSLFLSSKSARYAQNLMAQQGTEIDLLSQWHTSMLPYMTIVGKLLWPSSYLFVFPEFLLSACQYLLVEQYVRLLKPWCDSNVHSREFLLGSVLLDMGEAEKACDHFLVAANGVSNESFLASHLARPNYEDELEPTHEHRLVLYFLKVIKLFDQLDHSDCVLRIVDQAIRDAEMDDPEMATLHSIKFNHLLRIGRHSEAFEAMHYNPDSSRRQDSLRQLINSLVHHKKLHKLVDFSYSPAMLAAAEEVLVVKARSQHLMASEFYTVVHALHVKHLNYRKAASIKYEQAFRLSREVNGLASMKLQARCLQIAINELCLVPKEYQWVLKPYSSVKNATLSSVFSDYEPPNQSPKRNYDGEKIAQVDGVKKMEIVELWQMRRDSEVLLAKIELIGPDAANSLVSLVSNLSVEQFIGHLINESHFDLALRLSTLHELPKGSIMEAIAGKCVAVTRDDESDANICWLGYNYTSDVAGGDGSVSSVAWKYLQKCLKHHEESGRTEMHKAIVIKLIKVEAFLPQWLIDSYKKKNAAELLRILLMAGRLEEAGQLSCEMYNAGMGHGSKEFGMGRGISNKNSSVWLPLNLLMWCSRELEAAVVKDKLGAPFDQLLEDLKDVQAAYVEKLKRMSEGMQVKARMPSKLKV
ncbi:Hypothetical predicted protein [Cloeon dipterum]|uniref:Nuclear pore complex protein NUP160 domain-containing protein n=2 Tax=Cloeon dipterum TaxID=197152 RepID=A0A8S1D8B6_9INSE|nr:Hypothetical predicted protein [Cloeon dipterum]